MSVAYMLFLAFLLFQSPAGARNFMKVRPGRITLPEPAPVSQLSRAQHLSPTLGVELVERAYGEDCRPLYRNVRFDAQGLSAQRSGRSRHPAAGLWSWTNS